MLSLSIVQVSALNAAAAAIESAVGPVEALVLVVKDDQGVEWYASRRAEFNSWFVDVANVVEYSNGDRQVVAAISPSCGCSSGRCCGFCVCCR